MTNPCSNEIRAAVKSKYTGVARSAEGFFKYPTGRAGLKYLGYDERFFDSLPEQVVESFCGVGNPFSANSIKPGAVVLDIGSGAGFDVIYAAHLVGPTGNVYGIDLTPEMIAKAKMNIQLLQISHAQVQEGTAEAIPFADKTFDYVTSNGVLNLSPHKEEVFAEIYRVLKPAAACSSPILSWRKLTPASRRRT